MKRYVYLSAAALALVIVPQVNANGFFGVGFGVGFGGPGFGYGAPAYGYGAPAYGYGGPAYGAAPGCGFGFGLGVGFGSPGYGYAPAGYGYAPPGYGYAPVGYGYGMPNYGVPNYGGSCYGGSNFGNSCNGGGHGVQPPKKVGVEDSSDGTYYRVSRTSTKKADDEMLAKIDRVQSRDSGATASSSESTMLTATDRNRRAVAAKRTESGPTVSLIRERKEGVNSRSQDVISRIDQIQEGRGAQTENARVQRTSDVPRGER